MEAIASCVQGECDRWMEPCVSCCRRTGRSSGGASATTSSIVTKGGVSAGETKYYQHWYRDTDESPCDSGFNLTNGIEITWVL